MKTPKEIRQAIQTIWDEYQTIKEKAQSEERDLTAEEAERSEEIFGSMEKLKRDLEIAEKDEEYSALMETNSNDQKISQEPIQQPNQPVWDHMGEYFQAVIRANSSVGSFIGGQPSGRIDRRLATDVETRAAAGMSEGITQDGGFLVQQDYANTLIQLAHQTGKLTNRTFKLPIGPKSNSIKVPGVDESSRATGSRWGGIRVYHTFEAASATGSKPKFKMIQLGLNKLIGLVYLTDELIEDTQALEAWVTMGFKEEFGFTMDDDIINGNGVGMAQGILGCNALVTVAKETGQSATTFVAENAEKMFARMYSASLSKAVWYINQDVWPQIFQLHHAVGTGGVPMFIPQGDLSKSPNGTLLGRPIEPIEQCQTLGTKGDVIFADLSQYMTADKMPLQTATSIHVKFLTDEMALRFVYRFDGQPSWSSALTPYKGTNTQSPFVALAAR